MVRSAVLHQLTVMGEIARAISPDIRERHPQLPWTRTRGFRNVAVHEYFAIDWAAVLRLHGGTCRSWRNKRWKSCGSSSLTSPAQMENE